MSKCHSCFNINETCNLNVHMSCEADSKIKLAYVESCGSFNKKIRNVKYKDNTVTASHSVETRVEMMGGGHKDIDAKS